MWELWTAIGTVALAVIALVALFSQNRSFRLALAVDISMKLDDRFDRKEFQQLRSRAALALKTRHNQVNAEDVFDFFETVGLFTRLGAQTPDVVHSLFFHWINLYWNAGRDHIRMRQKDSKLIWKDFEALYQEVLEIERKIGPHSRDLELTAADIETYLDEEIGLNES
jgi:hypothetical protein